VGKLVGEEVVEIVGELVGEEVVDDVIEIVGDLVGEEVVEIVGELVGEEVVDDVIEIVGDLVGEVVVDDVMELVAVADLLGAGLGSERTGLGPHSYIPGGQISVPLTWIISMHTSLFLPGCWQGPEVFQWHIALQPTRMGSSISSRN